MMDTTMMDTMYLKNQVQKLINWAGSLSPPSSIFLCRSFTFTVIIIAWNSWQKDDTISISKLHTVHPFFNLLCLPDK